MAFNVQSLLIILLGCFEYALYIYVLESNGKEDGLKKSRNTILQSKSWKLKNKLKLKTNIHSILKHSGSSEKIQKIIGKSLSKLNDV